MKISDKRKRRKQRGWSLIGGAALFLCLILPTIAGAEAGIALEIRVKEFLPANPPVSAWVDSNTVLLPVGQEVYALQGNFGINLTVLSFDSLVVELQYRLATLGANVRQRSRLVSVELGIPVVIDSIPGKGKSYYRALLTPRPAKINRTCLEQVGEPGSWPYDPSAHFDFYYVKNSLADAHWNGLRDFLEQEYETMRKVFGFEFPGKVHFYFCSCRPELVDFEPRLLFGVDPSRQAGWAVYNKQANGIDPLVTNLLKFYRWWGFAPRFLAWGAAGYTDFADFYAVRYLRAGTLIPLDSLLVSADFRSHDPVEAYFTAASFVHYLIDSVGVVAFHDLYERSTDLSIKAAFLAVTGKTINAWEKLWREYLTTREIRYPELVFHAHRAQAIQRMDEHLEYLELGIADLGDSLSVSLSLELAMAYYAQGRYGDAYQWYQALIKAEPENESFRQFAGNVAAILGRLDEAEQHLTAALKLDSTYAPPWLSLGELMEHRGRADSAETLWLTGLKRGESIPIRTEILIHLAHRDRLRYRPEQAQERLALAYNATNRLLRQYPDHPRYLLRIAEVLIEMKKPDTALMYLEAAEFFETRAYYQARISLSVGKAHDLAGRRKDAVNNYERVFEVAAGYLTRWEAKEYINKIYR